MMTETYINCTEVAPKYNCVRFEWRWPVVASGEPQGVRTIYGYVTVVAEQESQASDAERRWALSFSDSEGRPIYTFGPDEFWVFAGAADRAMAALGMPPGEAGPLEPAGDIVR